jgi:hypothetical protein
MRSTRATYAVERLKTRSGHAAYAAVSLSGGLFYLVDRGSGKGTGASASASASAGNEGNAVAGPDANADADMQKLAVKAAAGSPVKLCEPLPLDAFVAFVDGFGPPKPSKASKLDLAFEEQLRKSRS